MKAITREDFPRACTRCGQIREWSEFVTCRARPCGVAPHCKTCDNLRQKPKTTRLVQRYREDEAYRERYRAQADWAYDRRVHGGRKLPPRHLTSEHRQNVSRGLRRFWRRRRKQQGKDPAHP